MISRLCKPLAAFTFLLFLIGCKVDPIKNRVGGNVTGLEGTPITGALVLKLNAGDATETLSITNNGGFQFTSDVEENAAYAVTVGSDPTNPYHECLVTNGAGAIADADITDVTVTCTISTPDTANASPTAIRESDDSITISWSTVPNALSYAIERCDGFCSDADTWEEIGTATTTSYSDAAPPIDYIDFSYRIKAINGSESDYSSIFQPQGVFEIEKETDYDVYLDGSTGSIVSYIIPSSGVYYFYADGKPSGDADISILSSLSAAEGVSSFVCNTTDASCLAANGSSAWADQIELDATASGIYPVTVYVRIYNYYSDYSLVNFGVSDTSYAADTTAYYTYP